MERSEIAIIIPAFNEEKTIGEVVKGALNYGSVIVVNDRSKDDTSNSAKKAGAIVVDHSENKGYDGALNTGFCKAKELGATYAITMDADGQHKEELLQEYIKLLREGYALVLGIRPSFARFAEALYGKIANMLWGIKDPLCGMKGYHLDLLDKNGVFDTVQSIGTELAVKSVKRKTKFIQIPIPIEPRVYGAPRFGKILKANIKIMMAMLRVINLKAF